VEADGVTLADLRARRDALDAEIREVEARERENWNTALNACEDALTNWLNEHKIEWDARPRKNETIWDIGHGALSVTFGADEAQYSRGLWAVSGRNGTLRLAWSEVPEPERFLAVVAVLLGKSAP
jgi:hypothetical protein